MSTDAQAAASAAAAAAKAAQNAQGGGGGGSPKNAGGGGGAQRVGATTQDYSHVGVSFGGNGTGPGFGAFMEWLWSTIDLSDNLGRVTMAVGRTANGLPAVLNCILGVFVTVIFGILALHFDLTSTWDAMTGMRDQLVTTVAATTGEQVDTSLTIQAAAQGGSFLAIVFSLFTFAPSVIELLGARFARFQIFWFQAAVIFFSAFDLFTDLPRVRVFMETTKPFFDTAPWLVGVPGYYALFLAMWFMASYGFELLTFLSAWATVMYGIKAFISMQTR